MAERTIAILAFNYTDGENNWRTAWKGQTLDLSPEDTERGDADGAFVTAEAEAAEEAVTITVDSTDEQLVAFVKEANVPEVVDAAAGDTGMAQRLLQAENVATGNDPRATVVSGLAAVAGLVPDGGGAPPEPVETPPTNPDGEGAETKSPAEPVDYSAWKAAELNAELEKRGIEFKPVGEKSSAKAEKLVADDQAKA